MSFKLIVPFLNKVKCFKNISKEKEEIISKDFGRHLIERVLDSNKKKREKENEYNGKTRAGLEDILQRPKWSTFRSHMCVLGCGCVCVSGSHLPWPGHGSSRSPVMIPGQECHSSDNRKTAQEGPPQQNYI